MWEGTASGEVEAHLRHLADIERDNQTSDARLLIMLKSFAESFGDGEKTPLDMDDLYVGVARLGLESTDLGREVLGGIMLAMDKGLIGTEHMTLLLRVSPKLDTWLKRHYSAVGPTLKHH